MDELKEKLSAVYERLQTLDINPTVTNMEKLLQSLYDIKEVYNKIGTKEEKQDAGDPNGETTGIQGW